MGEDFFTFGEKLGKTRKNAQTRNISRLGGCLYLLTLLVLQRPNMMSYFIVLYLAAKNFEIFFKIQNLPKVKNSNHISVNVLSWAYQWNHFQADLIWPNGTAQ
jgi:hypothetical protein